MRGGRFRGDIHERMNSLYKGGMSSGHTVQDVMHDEPFATGCQHVGLFMTDGIRHFLIHC